MKAGRNEVLPGESMGSWVVAGAAPSMAAMGGQEWVDESAML